jgi:hypothetical protein
MTYSSAVLWRKERREVGDAKRKKRRNRTEKI